MVYVWGSVLPLCNVCSSTCLAYKYHATLPQSSMPHVVFTVAPCGMIRRSGFCVPQELAAGDKAWEPM